MAEKREAARRELRWNLVQQLPLLVALILLWMALWGEISLLSSLSGLLVAVVVTRLFYLPPVELSGRFNIGWSLIFVGRLARDVVVASVVVSAQAFAPRVVSTNAIIAVTLRTSSDFIMTMTATAVSLVPGSIVVEIDRDTATLYLHVLGASGASDIAKARAEVLTTERSLVRAIGSRDDLEKVMA